MCGVVYDVYMYSPNTGIIDYISYLDAVLPKEFGISRKPWFFVTPIYRGIKWLYSRCTSRNDSSLAFAADEGEDLALLIKSTREETDPETVCIDIGIFISMI